MQYSRGRHRFWLKYINGNGKGYGAGLGNGGNQVNVNGWDAGVTVTPSKLDGDKRDMFDIYITFGSNGRSGDSRRAHVGTVTTNEFGDVVFHSSTGDIALASVRHVAGAE